MEFKHGGVLFQIYGLNDRKKRETFQLAYYVGSKRQRVTVRGDIEAAKKKAKELAGSITSGAAADALHLTALDRRVFLSAKQTCAPFGRAVDAVCREWAESQALLGEETSVLEVIREWQRRRTTGFPRANVKQVVEELIATLEGARRSASTVKSLKIPLKRFAKHFQMPIADVQTQEIQRWLQLYPHVAPRTANNWIAAVTRLFNFAKGRYLPRDASTVADALVPLSNDRRGAVAIFQPWEIAKILALAPSHLRSCIALGAFAGLRTIEIQRLDWSAIHWDSATDYPHGFIEIRGNVAKQHRTAARRIIPMQENLAKWLDDYRLSAKGRVSKYSSDKQLSRMISTLIARINVQQRKHKLPLLSRPENGLRHSYGSYRLPKVGSVELLALEMGNSRQEIIENYRELVHPDRVPDYWTIIPIAPVVQLDFALGA